MRVIGGHAGGRADCDGEGRGDVEPDHRERRECDAEEDGGEDGTSAEAAPEADRVGDGLGDEQDQDDLRRVLRDECSALRIARRRARPRSRRRASRLPAPAGPRPGRRGSAAEACRCASRGPRRRTPKRRTATTTRAVSTPTTSATIMSPRCTPLYAGRPGTEIACASSPPQSPKPTKTR